MNIQKQPSRGVPKKRFSENMRQIYTRTPMPKFVLLQVCYISSEHLFQRTPLDGCFWIYMFPQIANFFFKIVWKIEGLILIFLSPQDAAEIINLIFLKSIMKRNRKDIIWYWILFCTVILTSNFTTSEEIIVNLFLDKIFSIKKYTNMECVCIIN